MEYIQGKTLFTLKMEKIAEFFYDKFNQKYPDFFRKMKSLNKERDQHNINKQNLFDFQNDKEARDTMYNIISLLNDNQE